jgi:alpha-mannosidase
MRRLIVSELILTLLSFTYSTRAFAQSHTPLADMTLHVIPQAHIDVAWWWRYDPQTVDVVARRTLEMALANLDAHPDYTFTFLQVPSLQPMETRYPELFYKVHYYLYHSAPMGSGIPNPHGVDSERGRLKIAHAPWLEADPAVPSGESLVRQCLYGKRYYKYKFGLDIRSAWLQDAFTHPWTYPQILKKSGIDSYMFTRGKAGGNDERMFWWQAPDGSRVFAYKPASRGGQPSRERWLSEMAEVSKRYGVKDHIALVGVGNHGGGANSKDIADMRKIMAEMPGKARFSTHTQFLSAVLAQAHNFPVVNDEIGPTIRGVYTTVGEVKRKHRQSETLLLTLEKFSSVADRLGRLPYPYERLKASWEKLMLNQSHDAISGATLPPATDDALRLYDEILQSGKHDLEKALSAISSSIDTSGRGVPVILFNPLSWVRTDIAEVELAFDQPVEAVEIADADGKATPAQIVSRQVRDGKHFLTITFIGEGVPSLGYKVYHASAVRSLRPSPSPLKATAREMENEFFKVAIDPATGCVSSIFDKRNRREALDQSHRGNLLQVIEDYGDSEGFLKSADGKIDTGHRWTGKTWNVEHDPQIRLIESGPVRAVIEVKKKWELARFTQRVILYPRIPRVDFELDMDWKGKDKMVKLAFPLSVSAPQATYEIPYGDIRRPSQGEEQTAQKWVDISNQGYGVSLLNDGRNGFDITDHTIRMSVLRSPTAPAYSTDETGTHSLRYALYPHRQGWQEASTVERGYELNAPLISHLASTHSGGLPPAHSFLKVEPKNVIVEVWKRAEDSPQQYILRMYESEGKRCAVKLTWAQPVDAVHQIDLLENSTADLSTDGRGIQVPVSPYSIESFKLIDDNASKRRE